MAYYYKGVPTFVPLTIAQNYINYSGSNWWFHFNNQIPFSGGHINPDGNIKPIDPIPWNETKIKNAMDWQNF